MAASSKIPKSTKNVQIQCKINVFLVVLVETKYALLSGWFGYIILLFIFVGFLSNFNDIQTSDSNL
jgi:hypothetical protein